MQAGWVLAWFVLGSVVLSIAVFPAWWRQGWSRWLGAKRRRVSDPVRPRAASAVGTPTSRLIALSALLVALPALLMWAWVSWRPQSADAFDEVGQPANEQVAQLLSGEHLVPPWPLPPEVFLTAEVQAVRPMLASADRRWDQMDADFVQILLRVFKVMKDEHGYEMALLEGHRSPQRQAMLLSRGPSVTQAGPGMSYHQHGLAADCAFYREGKLVISEKDPWAQRGYELYGRVAEQHGLTWGGRWRMLDLGHVEWRKPGVRLRRDVGSGD